MKKNFAEILDFRSSYRYILDRVLWNLFFQNGLPCRSKRIEGGVFLHFTCSNIL